MPDVEITYNNNTITSLSDSGTEVLETSGTYLTDDITVQYTKSGGGGTGVNASFYTQGTVYYVDTDGTEHSTSAVGSFSATVPSKSLITVLIDGPVASSSFSNCSLISSIYMGTRANYLYVDIIQAD